MITSFNISGGGSKKDIEELKEKVVTLEGEYEALETTKADKSEIPEVGAIVEIEGGEGEKVRITTEAQMLDAVKNHTELIVNEIEETFGSGEFGTIVGGKLLFAFDTMMLQFFVGKVGGGTPLGNTYITINGFEYHDADITNTITLNSGDKVRIFKDDSIVDDTIELYNSELGYVFSKQEVGDVSVTATQDLLSVELAKASDIESTNEKIAEKADITEFVSLRDRVEEIELFSTPNVTIVGNPTIKSGQVSGFNVNNYLKFPYLVHLHDRTFSIHFCMTTSDDITNQQNILDSEFGLAIAIRNGRFVLAMGSDGQTWDMGEHIGTHTIETNTTYHVKLSWDKSTYKLEFGDTMDDSGDVVYILDIVVNDTKSLAAKEMFIGVGSDLTHIFGGSLNLNHCYLIMDDKVVWNGINGNLSTDLSNIDEDGKDVVKALAKQAQILWYGTQEQYDALEDKTQFNIYLISE